MRVRWRVGSRMGINILKQSWLQDDQNPYITMDLQVLGDNKVTSLMRMDRRTWEEDIMRDLLNESDHYYIYESSTEI